MLGRQGVGFWWGIPQLPGAFDGIYLPAFGKLGGFLGCPGPPWRPNEVEVFAR